MLYKHWLMLIVASVIILLMLVACTNQGGDRTGQVQDQSMVEETVSQGQQSANMRSTVLYYQDSDGYIIPVTRKIPWQESIAKAAITAITDQAAIREELYKMGLLPSVPANTTIKGISIKNGLATVDFSKDILNCSSAVEERNMVQAIVYTLTEFPTIDKVQIWVDGKNVKTLKYGTVVDKPLTATAINIESAAKDIDPKNSCQLMLYFTKTLNSSFTYLVPVTRVISASSPNIAAALEQLLKGPKEGGTLETAIPTGTKLLGVQVKDGVAYINLSKEFQQAGVGVADMEFAMKQIMMTVKQFDGIQKVKIQIDGKDMEQTEGVTAAQPVTIPTFANEY